ncbi:MAG: hypothetical protein RLZ75_2552 [Pseudomonadota bacterium]
MVFIPCIFSPLAASDLEEIGDYIAQDNPRRAITFVREIRERCQKIVAFPEAAQLHPEYGDGVRMIPHGRYLIFYTVQLVRCMNVRWIRASNPPFLSYGAALSWRFAVAKPPYDLRT